MRFHELKTKSMKQMKKKILSVAVVLLLLAGSVNAQSNVGSNDYTTALGVKFYPGGITLKHFLNDKAALEAIGYFYRHGTRITALYEFHFDIPNAAGLRWYVGPGAHLGFYNNEAGGGSVFGVDGVIGLDYKFREAPINLSLDWQPSFEFGGRNSFDGFSGSWGGLGIRYVFK
jgi:hypothetical protein